MTSLFASIVIPCHDAADTVARAVRSALGQTRPPDQIVCVDDGSSDETLAVLHALAREAPGRIDVVSQPNAGACAARNRGMSLVTAPYVQFLDADDWLHPGKLAHQLGLAEAADLAPDIVAGSFTRVRLDGEHVDHVARPGDPWAALAWVRLGVTSANLFRRATVERVGGWDTDVPSSQEYDLMFRMLRQGATVAFDPTLRTVLYQQAASITLATPEANVAQRIALGAAIRTHVRRCGAADAARSADDALFFLIQMRCAFSVSRGVASYHTHFAAGHVPPVGPRVGRVYHGLHRAVGFELAQRVRLASRRAVRRRSVPPRLPPLSLNP